MSELRDLTTALRTFDVRFTSIEECLVVLMRDSQQQSEWRHAEKNRVQIAEGLREEQELAMKQVQDACGDINRQLSELTTRLDGQASTRLDDVKELKGRVRELELLQSNEEVTKT